MRGILAGIVAVATFAVLAVTLSVGSTQPAPATSVKIGFVEQQRIITETQIGKRAQQQLKDLQNEKQAEIDRREQELKQLSDKIANEALPLTNQAREKLKREQRKKKADLDMFVSDAYDEADALNKKNSQKIQKLVEQTAAEMAKELGYSIILERLGVVLYGNPRYDLTDEMIKRIDKITQAKPGQGGK